MAIGWMIVSVPAGKWIYKYGYRMLFIIGNSLQVFSGVLLVLLNEHHGFWYVLFIMIIQGLAWGLISTVGMIGVQQLVGAHEKGISTSFFLFSRNMGTAIGITLMGALLTNAETFIGGIHNLFLFGFIGSIVAMITAFLIKNEDSGGPIALKTQTE